MMRTDLVGSWHHLTSVDTVDRNSRAMIWTNATVLAMMWTAWFTFCAVIWSGNNFLREQLFSRTAVCANSCSPKQLFANGLGYLDTAEYGSKNFFINSQSPSSTFWNRSLIWGKLKFILVMVCSRMIFSILNHHFSVIFILIDYFTTVMYMYFQTKTHEDTRIHCYSGKLRRRWWNMYIGVTGKQKFVS